MNQFKRKKLGIIFSNDGNWIGGTYYFLNLISSFLMLDDKDRPEVVIMFWEPENIEVVKKTGYPYLSFLNSYIPYSFHEKILFKLFPKVIKKNIVKKYHCSQFDILFPATFSKKFDNINNKIFWVPDFQEYYYPNFFNNVEIEQRKEFQKKISLSKNHLVLSSLSVKKDFEKFYPNAICKTHVVNFAVTHPKYDHLSIAGLKAKFNISKDYYISPNQFWQHKNHLTVLRAVKLLKEINHEILVVFTGKERDYRNPAYVDDLKLFVKDHGLENNVMFLGFIDRAEQLQLMNYAKAVIQPSLFEGWSTVVEDAKAMSQYIIASDLPVHREQLDCNVSFFTPTNEDELVNALIELEKNTPNKIKIDYVKNVRDFSDSFIKIMQE